MVALPAAIFPTSSCEHFVMIPSKRYLHHLVDMSCLGLLIGLAVCFSAVPAVSAERLAVSAPFANIRSGPATTSDILWQIEKFHPIEVLKTSGNWYYFRDFEGDEGWIHSSLVQKIATLITIQDECTIRSGPGTSFSVLFTVGKGIPFKVLERKGSWVHVQHADGDNGWIHQSLVW
ncbi:MAG: SH3 domain-containing protein [Thermodesulfobacteriota bacterium]